MEKRVRKKQFIFPEDVQSDYNPIKGISLKNLLYIIVPFCLLGIAIVGLPPYNIIMFFTRAVVGAVVASIGFAIVLVKPVPYRKNISFLDWIRFNQDYSKRAKLFYIKEKQKKFINE